MSLRNRKKKNLKSNTVLTVCGMMLLGMMVMVQPVLAKTVLRLAHSESTTNIRHEAALFFAERLEKLTKGDLKVEIYPAGQMGTHTQCQEMVATGALDIYPTTAGLVSVFDEKRSQELLELPYLFDNYAQAYAFMDSDFATMIYEPLKKKGIHYLATWDNGFRHMTNSKRPILIPQDMKGLKVRVVKSEMSINIINAMGGNAVPMAYSELYTALGSGVVDGQENPFMNIYASKFYEVQKFMSTTKHQYSTLPLIFSETRWQTLNKDQRAAIKQVSLETAAFMRKKNLDTEAKLRAAMEKEGMMVNDVPDLTPFRESMKQVYTWARGKWGADKVEEVLKKVDEVRKMYPNEGSYIGVEIK